MTRPPLAERLRPTTLDEVVGQKDLLAVGRPLRQLIQGSHLPSMIFWGPPGVGKTTVARVIARTIGSDFRALSAVEAGVADIRELIILAENMARTGQHLTIFLDEIHRFNKAQQDRLLRAVEDGTITLIGATTENPSFEVISALLSRSRVFVFKELTAADLGGLIDRALTSTAGYSGTRTIAPDARTMLIDFSGGDARALLNTLEIAASIASTAQLTLADIQAAYGEAARRYDKSGEEHYNHASAFIKSLRGSSVDAALFYMFRMIAGGEDPLFIARRMVIFASEDIGNAMPNALVLATSCFTAVSQIGYPESELTLTQTAIYLARAPKSRASNNARDAAKSFVAAHPDIVVPLHLRNPVTGLMREAGYGGYLGPTAPGFAHQKYLPPELEGTTLYTPSGSGMEQ